MRPQKGDELNRLHQMSVSHLLRQCWADLSKMSHEWTVTSLLCRRLAMVPDFGTSGQYSTVQTVYFLPEVCHGMGADPVSKSAQYGPNVTLRKQLNSEDGKV